VYLPLASLPAAGTKPLRTVARAATPAATCIVTDATATTPATVADAVAATPPATSGGSRAIVLDDGGRSSTIRWVPRKHYRVRSDATRLTKHVTARTDLSIDVSAIRCPLVFASLSLDLVVSLFRCRHHVDEHAWRRSDRQTFVGGRSPRTGAAAEREGIRHRVTFAAQHRSPRLCMVVQYEVCGCCALKDACR